MRCTPQLPCLQKRQKIGWVKEILLYYGQNCSNIWTKNLFANMKLLLEHWEENIEGFPFLAIQNNTKKKVQIQNVKKGWCYLDDIYSKLNNQDFHTGEKRRYKLT